MYGSIKDDFRNAWSRPNNVVVQIIIINVVIFVLINLLKVLFYFGPGDGDGIYSTIKSLIALPSNTGSLIFKPWTFFTYMFVHEGFFHVLFNMLWLYWFGRLIQEYLGSKRVIGLYIMGGLAGGLVYVLVYNMHPIFEGVVESSKLIGASAGTTALIVGAAVFMPNYTLYLMFLGPVKIKYIAGVVVFLSVIGTTGGNAGGQFAHLGGAIMGWIFISQIRKGSDWGSWVINGMDFFKSIFRPRPKIKVTHRSAYSEKAKKKSSKSTRLDGASQDEIDTILDKISHSGYESLSKEEKQKLFNASSK